MESRYDDLRRPCWRCVMLSKLLIASENSTPYNGIEFVGGASFSSTGTSHAISLTALSGGLDAQPRSGDLVVACAACLGAADVLFASSDAEYIKAADLYVNTSSDSNLAVFYKRLSAADTGLVISSSYTATLEIVVHVWRGAHSNPLDASPVNTTATFGPPSPGAITTATDGSVVIAIGAQATSSSYPLSAPSAPLGMANLVSSYRATQGVAIASVLRESAGTYSPGAFGGFVSQTNRGTCCSLMAIKPKV